MAAALLLASAPALAQVYSWRDPATGQSKFSNIAPPWYNRGEAVSGPRVVATVGDRVIDDTALPYEERLRLSGKSQEYIDGLRPQIQQGDAARQIRNPAPDATQAAGRRSADTTAIHTRAGTSNGG